MSDVRHLVELLVATAEVIGDEIRPSAAALMVEELSMYPLPSVVGALAACRRELKGRLSLAAILERIDDGHPTPNEAWAIAFAAADERNTVVWSAETRDAWDQVRALYDVGDRIGARMAFLEKYSALVKAARAARRPASHGMSLGHDADVRDLVLRKAVERGQLTHAAVAPHLALPAPALGFNPVALLSGSVEVLPDASPDIAARFAQLRKEIDGDAP